MPTASSLRDSVSPSLPSTYAELHVTTNFTFLTGASHPEEFVERAAALGLGAIAITDRNSLAGVVRAHIAAKETGIPLVVGCRVELTAKDSPSPSDTSRLRDSVPSCLDRETSARSSAARDGVPPRNGASDINTTSSLRDFVSSSLSILLFPTSRSAYGHLCQLLTLGKRRAPKGECHLTLDDVLAHHEGLLAVVIPPPVLDDAFTDVFHRLKRTFDDDRLSLAVSREYGPNDHARLAHLAELARDASIPLVATNDVHYHIPERRKLQDVVTCIRHGCTIHEAGFRLIANAERPLKAPKEMARLFAAYPDAITRTVEIAQRALQFNLDELRYEYPDEVCPQGMTPMQHLRRLTWRGADERYPGGIPDRVRAQVEHEFELIEELNYAPYFLTVHDLVIFARSRGILCQGRGAAANSAVCYCLGVTAVDPDRIDLLFERFVSKERNEPPDIDIDFEHERREEVIQYIYRKYGRDRAALTAEVISYRGRSAVREVGKAMGLSLDCVDRLAKNIDWWHDGVGDPRVLRDIGVNPDDPTIRAVMALSHEILGFPRHLSQHVGGFVITRTPLSELVPIENAAMPDRTVIEWDKDDIDAMGMLKVDCLGLGMLTCISKALRLVNEGRHGGRGKRDEETERRRDGETRRRSDRKGSPPTTLSLRDSVSSSLPDRPLELHTIPPEDPLVYDMICAADTIGVFQIESRAQMTMLPRLRPRCFYDLVIEVAIVRPGPIQGDMVHPYLRRRNGEEPVTFPNDEVKKVLGKTLGVPLFQEQAMSLAIVAAGFTPGEADRLRRAMAAWKRSGNQMKRFGERFITGMLARGYERDFAERCFRQIQGFSDYGFPESHAASFALLVYVSAWLKRHHPAEFAAALINSQPMGFYAPAQIVRDAQEHGVEVRPIDVQCSEWDCTVEEGDEETESRRDGVVGCAATHTHIAPGEYTGGEGARIHDGSESDGAVERRRDGETERRSEDDKRAILVEINNGGNQNVSGYRGVAEGNGTHQVDLPPDETDAVGRAVRTGKTDARGSGVDSVQHRRRIRSSGQAGSPEVPAHRARLAVRIDDAVRTRDRFGTDRNGLDDQRPDHGDGSCPPGFDSQPGRQGHDRHRVVTPDRQPTPSLRDSVSSSLPHPHPPLRLGMRLVKGLCEDDARAIADAVAMHGPFDSIEALRRASGVRVAALRRLARADAFGSMGLDRQQALWAVRALADDDELPMFKDVEPAAHHATSAVKLPEVSQPRKVAHDYESMHLSLKAHPISFLRDELSRMRITEARELADEDRWPNGKRIAVAGLVLVRQRPSTAGGVIFMTLEDETGISNLIVRPGIYKQYRRIARHGVAIIGRGKIERQGAVVHIMVDRFDTLDDRLADLAARSRDFH